MKRISVLGSTGSIGRQTLDVIRQNPDRFKVVALTCGKNTALMAEQIEEFHPRLVVTSAKRDAEALAVRFPGSGIAF
ncbi:MAG: 1-deoxy-D-xylulose-5-phosphate reductoisomerase, partial [Firmicutes bacterium]|nr:1-deoxy-D-xylulose-5-phosphate reductoisomerase [Bacillota bacterium]